MKLQHLFYIFLALTIGFIFSCKSEIKKEMKSLLVGNWKAAALIKNDSIQDIDLETVRLHFTDYNRYYYVNNLMQAEAGYFKIKDSLLIYTDTTANPEHESAVHIQKITQDTMILRMNLEGKEAFMIFKK